MGALERRIEALEDATPADARVSIIHLVPLGVEPKPEARHAWGSGQRWERCADESEAQFLAHATAAAPGVILLAV